MVGATGKFGRSIIAQTSPEIEIVGAVSSNSNPLIGRKLNEMGISDSNTVLSDASHIADVVARSDVVVFVSRPEADLANVPKVASKGKRIVVGTTGFTQSQLDQLRSSLANVPNIIESNFSIGANLLFKIAELVSHFNELYDYSIVEQHHKMKVDAPSGTARKIVQLLNGRGAFPVTVTDRTSKPKREEGEIEVISLRGGGTPGIHELILTGENEMIRIEHLAFSRAAAATGLLLACRWLASKVEPGIYSMADVLQDTLNRG